MQDKIYLLSLKEVLQEPTVEKEREADSGKVHRGEQSTHPIIVRAMDKLDEERRRKASSLKVEKKQLESIGAGLLLQFVVQEAMSEGEVLQEKQTMLAQTEAKESGEEATIKQVSWKQLLEQNKSPINMEYIYGEKGKPFFQNLPYYFSLSHSGDYVLCVLSDQEVGADIQKKEDKMNKGVLKHFFSEEEQKQWEQYSSGKEQRDFFYKLWCRKEAYGKLTGDGIGPVIHMNMCNLSEGELQKVSIQEFDLETSDTEVICEKSTASVVKTGYQIAVCKWK